MECNNCFNGCSEIISDDCVRYTGIDIPTLGISTGDTLSSVELSITTFLIAALNGTGIVPVLDESIICTLVQNNLPVNGDINIVHIVSALIKSVCSLQEQVTTNTNSLTTLNADYVIQCLSGVAENSGTHQILQASIDKICETVINLEALSLIVSTNYVQLADLDSYINSYLTSIGATTLISSKMVPFTAIEYYGDLSQFDVTGAGIGDWVKIYLCNGNNGTPDKRGRVAVGTTSGMGGGTFDTAVDPAIPGNPAYSLLTPSGINFVTLNSTQIPAHSHTGVTDTAGAHTHVISEVYNENNSGTLVGSGGGAIEATGTQVTSTAGAHSHGLVIDSTGGGLSHPNVQPSLACHYIIYIP
jgi:microcystin-dependent protein